MAAFGRRCSIKILKFVNFHKQQPVPFVIQADFEAITEKIQGCQQNDDSSYTEAYQKDTDCGYGYNVVCCYNDKYKIRFIEVKKLFINS